MESDVKNQSLGEFIRERRLSRGLLLTEAAEDSGLHVSYWSKLEAGQYESPSPKHLQPIARTLGVDFEDLYGLAGYESPERLPSFKPYLRTKYDLPPEAVADMEKYFAHLRAYYGIPQEQPVFPPKKPTVAAAPNLPKKDGDVSERRAS